MAAEKDNECFFFGKVNNCPGSKEKLSKCGRMPRIIDASKVRNHLDIHDLLVAGTVIHVVCHKKCVSTYVSPQNPSHMSQRRKPQGESKPLSKRLRRETLSKTFDFKKHCLFYLEITGCKLDNEYDAKTHVQYRISASMVATTEICDGKAYIETLMKKCRNRNDDLGHAVYDRLLAADGDLVAAEARYHRKCSCLFHKRSESNDDRSHSEVDTALC